MSESPLMIGTLELRANSSIVECLYARIIIPETYRDITRAVSLISSPLPI